MKNIVAEFSVEELKKEKTKIKGVAIGLGIVMTFASGFLVYVLSQSGKYGLVGIIPSLYLTLFPVFVRMGQVNTELKARK